MKKRLKKRLKVRGTTSELTKSEREVLYFLTKEYLTKKRIAIRRGTSIQAVYKILKKLQNKGQINHKFQEVEKNRCTLPSKSQKIRLHGIEYNINILFSNHRYKERIKKSNNIMIDGNTVRLYRNSIELYINHSFYGDDVQDATAKSIKYLNRLIPLIENDLKVILIKNRKQNIKLVRSSYAETNNEFAKECNVSGDKIRIKATEDNKVWFTIDNSFNLHEAETQHPETAKHDMEYVIKPFFDDLRDNNPPTLSDVMKLLKFVAETSKQTIEINKETASGLNAVVTYLKSQIPEKPKEGKYKRPDYMG